MWESHSLNKKLARLSCALFNDYVYIISNNSNIVHRYCPNNHVLDEWLVLESAQNNLEFAGLAAYQGKLYISGGQQEENTLRLGSRTTNIYSFLYIDYIN